MMIYRALLCAFALSYAAAAPVAAAGKKAPTKAKKAPPGRTETLACRLGTEDRHARIAVVVIRGKTDSFAYYSKWKPRTCSVYLQRKGDMYSKWADNGAITTVSLEKGAFLIEHKPGEYHFIFRDIDRERYCGMDGVINGSLTIKRGSDQCVLDGDIMVEGTPLGEALIARQPESPSPAAGASDVAVATDASPSGKDRQQKPVVVEVAPKVEAAPKAELAPQAEVAPKPAAAEAAPAVAPLGATVAIDKAAAETPPVAPAITAKKAPEPPSSGNSIGAFFKSLKPNRPEDQNP